MGNGIKIDNSKNIVDKDDKYLLIFNFALNFLDEMIKDANLNRLTLERYIPITSQFKNLNDINRRLIESLSNRQMMPSVIKFKQRNDVFKELLFNFDPKLIIYNYSDSNSLFITLQKHFQMKNIESKRNLWRKFSEGIISGSKFIGSFKSKEEFDKFVRVFSLNKYTSVALPMLLSREIDGFGFALSCDFLKELGYRDYPKPDVHLMTIFYELGFVNIKNDYEVYKEIISMALSINKDPYTVDKVFWLISSGNFYLDNIKIPGRREDFINKAKEILKTNLKFV